MVIGRRVGVVWVVVIVVGGVMVTTRHQCCQLYCFRRFHTNAATALLLLTRTARLRRCLWCLFVDVCGVYSSMVVVFIRRYL